MPIPRAVVQVGLPVESVSAGAVVVAEVGHVDLDHHAIEEDAAIGAAIGDDRGQIHLEVDVIVIVVIESVEGVDHHVVIDADVTDPVQDLVIIDAGVVDLLALLEVLLVLMDGDTQQPILLVAPLLLLLLRCFQICYPVE
jgi:hypothetical protein